jgi:nitroimidazol reductase NimA-like FMN-containing flavoprotein (pyridoxamine 5'-phosphate oxidase superfamily)
MNTPDTTLDRRFSDPEAEATSWAETKQALAAAQLFWITTVRRDERPHVTPLVAIWLDDALYFTTGPDEQKAVNLRHNKQVALTTGRNEWERGIDVVVEGEAERVTEQPLLARLAEAWTAKWDGRWRYGVGDGCFRNDHGEALVFRVRPSKVFAFAKGRFGQTRHRFGGRQEGP